jgi:hypothetical protein
LLLLQCVLTNFPLRTSHRLDVELEDLAIALHTQLQAVIGRQVKVKRLGASTTEAATLEVTEITAA